MTNFKQGCEFERNRIVAGLSSILDAGGGIQDVRNYLSALESKETASRLDLDGTSENFKLLAIRTATALDAYCRHIPGSRVDVQKLESGSLHLSLSVDATSSKMLVMIDPFCFVSSFVFKDSVQIVHQAHGSLDPDDTDVFFQSLRQHVSQLRPIVK